MEKNLKNTPEMENVNENAATEQQVKTPFYKKGWFKKAMIALGAAAVIGGGVLVAKKVKACKATECDEAVDTDATTEVAEQPVETPRDRFEERRNNRWGGEDRPRHKNNNN